MFQPSVKLSKELMARVKRCSDAAGYSSPDEFVQHVIEKELARIEEEAASEEEIVKTWKGRGNLE